MFQYILIAIILTALGIALSYLIGTEIAKRRIYSEVEGLKKGNEKKYKHFEKLLRLEKLLKDTNRKIVEVERILGEKNISKSEGKQRATDLIERLLMRKGYAQYEKYAIPLITKRDKVILEILSFLSYQIGREELVSHDIIRSITSSKKRVSDYLLKTLEHYEKEEEIRELELGREMEEITSGKEQIRLSIPEIYGWKKDLN